MWKYWVEHYICSFRDKIFSIRRDWNFDLGFKTDDGSLIWSETKLYPFHEPIVNRINYMIDKCLDRNISHRHEREEHKFRSELDTTSDEGLNISLLYVDNILVAKCYDTEEAIKAYKEASDRQTSDEDFFELEACYKILVKLQDDVQSKLFKVLTNRDFIRHNCKYCPLSEETGLQEQIRPTWATQSAYESLLQTHFDELAEIGERIWARLETILRVYSKYGNQGTLEMEGNIIDGFTLLSYLPGDIFKFGHTYDINGKSNIEQLDCLLGKCINIHFNYELPEDTSNINFHDINFETLEPKIVDRLRSFLDKESFIYRPECPICAALNIVFER